MVDQIERELLLPAPPEEVWDIVIAPGWLADDVVLELVPGGDAQFVSDGQVKDGWIEEAVAPGTASGEGGRLAFWWAADGDPATRVELTLEPEGEASTRLRVIEARPLDVLDVVGIPLPGSGGASHGPALLAAA
jgi:uncharacterized protein YndB with AHSA1/START domain